MVTIMLRLSLRATLTGLFSVITVVVLLLGAVSLWGVTDMEDDYDAVTKVWYPSAGATADLVSDIYRTRISTANHANASDPAKQPPIEENIKSFLMRVEQSLQKLEKRIDKADLRKEYDPIAERVTSFMSMTRQHVEIARKGDRAAALVLRNKIDELIIDIDAKLIELAGVIGMRATAVMREAHQHSEETIRNVYILMAVSIMVVLLSGAVVVFRLSRPLAKAIAVTNNLASGALKTDVPFTERRDEIGELARATLSFRNEGAAAARIYSALDTSPANVIVVDEAYEIVFSNRAFASMVQANAAEFQRAFPTYNQGQMIGCNIGSLHPDPADQRRVLSQLTSAHATRIPVGQRMFDLISSPVFNSGRERIGFMLEWRDMTEELSAQAEVRSMADAIAAGDFSSRINVANKTGFLRDLADNMNQIASSVDQATTELADTLNSISAGDLTRKVETSFNGRLNELKNAINATADTLAQTIKTIQTTSAEVAVSAREINSGAQDLAHRTESQATSLEETNSTTMELTDSVKQSAASSQQALVLAEQARQVATSGGVIVNNAVEAMGRIENASRRISDITIVIKEIAFQTNMLALNASVEAARAGDAGKGFAVVAAEVGTLAKRSSEAVKDIGVLIDDSSLQISTGVELVRSAGEVLDQIVDGSKRVAEMIASIAAASWEQANGVDVMARSVTELDQMTQQNAALAEESSASATSLSAQIARLDQLIATFQTGTEYNPGAIQSGRRYAA